MQSREYNIDAATQAAKNNAAVAQSKSAEGKTPLFGPSVIEPLADYVPEGALEVPKTNPGSYTSLFTVPLLSQTANINFDAHNNQVGEFPSQEGKPIGKIAGEPEKTPSGKVSGDFLPVRIIKGLWKFFGYILGVASALVSAIVSIIASVLSVTQSTASIIAAIAVGITSIVIYLTKY
jgi:hypothetical protein